MSEQPDEIQVEPRVIKCPKCGSARWDCWDERSFNCWNRKTGSMEGSYVVGYLRCKDCNTAYVDMAIGPRDIEDDECWCEDWD